MDLRILFLLLLTLCVTASYTNGCIIDSQCPTYAECSFDKCKCKFGEDYPSLGEPTICNRECRFSWDCTENADCNTFNKCSCKYGTGDRDYKGKLTSCPECRYNSDCTDNAECNIINKCRCKNGIGDRDDKGKLTSCPDANECTWSYECPSNAICSFGKCDCKYGGEVKVNGRVTYCSANVPAIIGGIVGICVFITIIIALVYIRRRRLARLQQPTVWIATPANAVHTVPATSTSYPASYPVQQYQPVTQVPQNQGQFNAGFQPGYPPQYTPEPEK